MKQELSEDGVNHVYGIRLPVPENWFFVSH